MTLFPVPNRRPLRASEDRAIHDLKVDDMAIQHILRHSNINVTRESYIHTLPQQKVGGMKPRPQAAWLQVATTVQ